MGEAAPQAADGISGEDIGNALDVLAMLYEGEGREFGHDAERGFWVTEAGRIGPFAAAPTAGELAREIDGGGGLARAARRREG